MMLGRLRNASRGFFAVVSLVMSFAVAGQDVDAAARRAFVDKMVSAHGFDRAQVTKLIDAAVIDQTIITTMSRPAGGVVPWFEYPNIFYVEERMGAGVIPAMAGP